MAVINNAKCYILYPVHDNAEQIRDTVLYYSTTDTITEGFYEMSVVVDGIQYIGTFYVTRSTTACPSQTTDAEIQTEANATPYCYYVTTGAVTYVNNDDALVTAAAPVNVCSKITPQVNTSSGTTPVVQFNGECESGVPCGSTPKCYLLTNCKDSQLVIQSKSTALAPYEASNLIVSLSGYEGCWIVTKADNIDDCDCAVSVIVTKSYNECVECEPVIAYKLTNCSTNSIKFTLDDLAEYVGKTVKTDCQGCWVVQRIYQKPPTVETIVIEEVYDGCVECLRKYWILIDCNSQESSIVTYTDMTQYLDKIIKLANSDTCWSVYEYTDTINQAIEVDVFANYEDCFTCGPNLNCNCIRLTNDSTETKTYTYEGCYTPSNTAPLILYITLQPNQSSDKMCIAKFITPLSSTDILIQYGACIENPNLVTSGPSLFFDAPPFVCPTVFTGRAVTPGYTVPSCSVEKFESITCNASEILYKQVLQLRYGLTNCCPDEDDKWLIRKELIDLASLKDKNYDCTSVDACCAPAQCGCSTCGS